MSHPVITCHVNDPLDLAAQRMWDHDCGALAVVNDDGQLTGMITDRDICMAAFTQGKSLGEILTHVAMSQQVFAVSPDQPLGEAEDLLARHRVHRLPVVDAGGKPIGMVSTSDLARESVRPAAQRTHSAAKLAQTLATICARRTAAHPAA